ncbi:ImpA family metalloprotease [Aeromonas enteropelogenes]|uniref:ImpA family metalloprotease n=1 Tax=Aeromonas enteropelogenes TaxID=29489 RepID=UPI003B9F07C3
MTGPQASAYCNGKRLATKANLDLLRTTTSVSTERVKYPTGRAYLVSDNYGGYLTYDLGTGATAAYVAGTTASQYAMCVKYAGDGKMSYTPYSDPLGVMAEGALSPVDNYNNWAISDGETWWEIGEVISDGGADILVKDTYNYCLGSLSDNNVRLTPAGCAGGRCTLELKGASEECGGVLIRLNNTNEPSQGFDIQGFFAKDIFLKKITPGINNGIAGINENTVILTLQKRNGDPVPNNTTVLMRIETSPLNRDVFIEGNSGALSHEFTTNANGEIAVRISSLNAGSFGIRAALSSSSDYPLIIFPEIKTSVTFVSKPIVPEDYFLASTESSQGGKLTPVSLQLPANGKGDFTVEPDTGFELAEINGCSGTLNGLIYTTGPMVSDCIISARFTKQLSNANAAKAIAHEDHTLASDLELIDYARSAILESEINRVSLVKTLFHGIEKISWNPSHDAITFSSFQPENTVTLLPSNINGKGEPEVNGLVMVSERNGYRQAAMAANMFSVDSSTESKVLLKNLIGWLAQGKDTDGLSIITAQMPGRADSQYFPHNERVREWLTEIYPDAHSINKANMCDYQALVDCIEDMSPDLIVISDIDRQKKGFQAIESAITRAKELGIPLLLSNYQRAASPMLSPLYQEMGLVSRGNYWAKLKASNLAVNTIAASDQQLMMVDTLLSNLKDENFNTDMLTPCWENFLNCTDSDDFNHNFKMGADWLRNAVITMDGMAKSAFSFDGGKLLPASLLLADKYRVAIDYPITWDEHQAWFQAMFADWLVNYARARNLVQPDLGEYVIDRRNVVNGHNAHYTYPGTFTDRKRITVPYSKQWTTTGWYALPGQNITLTRMDNFDTSVSVRLNYHRPNTNRAYEQHIFRAPLELTTARLPLSKGSSISFTSPYGGPIYLYLDGKPDELQVDVSANGITHHPTITDFNSEAQVDIFNKLLENTELPHVDLRSDGVEQHLRRDRFTDAIVGNIPNTNALLQSIAQDHVNNVYTLGGFKVQGKSLVESLPDDVRHACISLLGDKCIDESLHTRAIIQHANYDQNAHCGVGCAGNPWDSSSKISPTDWLDNHELGHNLQTNRLNVQYASADDADNWGRYRDRAEENSNNIFPYFVKWKSHYKNNDNIVPLKDGHMNHKDLFYVFMSDVAQVKNKHGERVVLDRNCKVLDVGDSRYEAPWKSEEYAVHNGYRMAFYIQMALRSHGMLLADGTRLENGFNIFTLLYQHSRIFSTLANNEVEWDANKEKIGFGLFPFAGHPIYAGKSLQDIPGNDFMIVALSKLTGWDWRSHFDLLGLRYSSLAGDQVQANQRQGDLPMGMYVLEDDLPPVNMSEGLTFLPLSTLDSEILWPRDNSSPKTCPTPNVVVN